jgi:uncharacterized protein YjiS (DUF1127 family)
MHVISTARSAPGALLSFASALRATAAAVATLAARLDAWLARRERTARDREALAQMSDRDLKDIGLSRGYLDNVANGAWIREPGR